MTDLFCRTWNMSAAERHEFIVRGLLAEAGVALNDANYHLVSAALNDYRLVRATPSWNGGGATDEYGSAAVAASGHVPGAAATRDEAASRNAVGPWPISPDEEMNSGEASRTSLATAAAMAGPDEQPAGPDGDTPADGAVANIPPDAAFGEMWLKAWHVVRGQTRQPPGGHQAPATGGWCLLAGAAAVIPRRDDSDERPVAPEHRAFHGRLHPPAVPLHSDGVRARRHAVSPVAETASPSRGPGHRRVRRRHRRDRVSALVRHRAVGTGRCPWYVLSALAESGHRAPRPQIAQLPGVLRQQPGAGGSERTRHSRTEHRRHRWTDPPRRRLWPGRRQTHRLWPQPHPAQVVHIHRHRRHARVDGTGDYAPGARQPGRRRVLLRGHPVGTDHRRATVGTTHPDAGGLPSGVPRRDAAHTARYAQGAGGAGAGGVCIQPARATRLSGHRRTAGAVGARDGGGRDSGRGVAACENQRRTRREVLFIGGGVGGRAPARRVDRRRSPDSVEEAARCRSWNDGRSKRHWHAPWHRHRVGAGGTGGHHRGMDRQQRPGQDTVRAWLAAGLCHRGALLPLGALHAAHGALEHAAAGVLAVAGRFRRQCFAGHVAAVHHHRTRIVLLVHLGGADAAAGGAAVRHPRHRGDDGLELSLSGRGVLDVARGAGGGGSHQCHHRGIRHGGGRLARPALPAAR
eukprot:ctg_457.g235